MWGRGGGGGWGVGGGQNKATRSLQLSLTQLNTPLLVLIQGLAVLHYIEHLPCELHTS